MGVRPGHDTDAGIETGPGLARLPLRLGRPPLERGRIELLLHQLPGEARSA